MCYSLFITLPVVFTFTKSFSISETMYNESYLSDSESQSKKNIFPSSCMNVARYNHNYKKCIPFYLSSNSRKNTKHLLESEDDLIAYFIDLVEISKLAADMQIFSILQLIIICAIQDYGSYDLLDQLKHSEIDVGNVQRINEENYDKRERETIKRTRKFKIRALGTKTQEIL